MSTQVRSEEHTSELQSLTNLVCRLLLEKKNTHHIYFFNWIPERHNKHLDLSFVARDAAGDLLRRDWIPIEAHGGADWVTCFWEGRPVESPAYTVPTKRYSD